MIERLRIWLNRLSSKPGCTEADALKLKDINGKLYLSVHELENFERCISQLQHADTHPEKINLRLFDLVRHSRADLHEQGLVTDAEYAWLCGGSKHTQGPGSPSPRRLEAYDELRAAVTTHEKRLLWLEREGHSFTHHEDTQQPGVVRASDRRTFFGDRLRDAIDAAIKEESEPN